MTYTYTPEILTHEPYRMTCDDCGWVSGSHKKLSPLCKEIGQHTRDKHMTRYEGKVPPSRPVLSIV